MRAFHFVALVAAAGCASLPIIGRSPKTFWITVAPSDSSSVWAASTHSRMLDAVISGVITLDSATGMPTTTVASSADRSPDVKRLALVSAYPETVRRLAENPELLTRSAAAIADQAAENGYGGLIIAFDDLGPGDVAALTAVSGAFSRAADARDLSPIGLSVPPGDTSSYPGRVLIGAMDFILVRLTAEHWLTSPPGPPASPQWARRMLGVRIAEVGPSRIVAEFPLHGLVWTQNGAVPISFADAQRLAAEAAIELQREPSSATLHATRSGQWDMWVADAVLLDSLIRDAERAGVRKFALWRAGLEDPAVWPLVTGR